MPVRACVATVASAIDPLRTETARIPLRFAARKPAVRTYSRLRSSTYTPAQRSWRSPFFLMQLADTNDAVQAATSLPRPKVAEPVHNCCLLTNIQETIHPPRLK